MTKTYLTASESDTTVSKCRCIIAKKELEMLHIHWIRLQLYLCFLAGRPGGFLLVMRSSYLPCGVGLVNVVHHFM